MYLSHFGLNQSPFGITPNPAFFYAGNKRGAILEALIYAVSHGEGIVKVTGEVGSGKTMLCRMLESMLPTNIEVIYLVNPTLSREEVVFAIAGELELATGGKRPDEVIRLLQNDLIAKHVAGKQVVLLVEEAQAMPLDTLEEIRLFSNLETAHHKLLQIVLFGQPELDESLNLPRMRQLKERITHSFKVPPLAPTVIPEYLMFRMRAAGYHGPDIFSSGAIKQIAAVSEGIVRRISILADKSLLAAFADNMHSIEAKHVKAAIQDSEFSHSISAKRSGTLVPALLLTAALLAAIAIGLHALWPTGNNLAPSNAILPAAVINTTTTTHSIATTTVAATTTTTVAPAPATSKPMDNKTAALSAATTAAVTTPAPPMSASVLQQRLEVTRNWLKNEDPNRFTVQISLESSDHAQVEHVILKTEADIGTGNVYVFPTRLAGAPRFGVTYGSYPTREEALAVLTALSRKLGYKPQLRTINRIRQEMERTQSANQWGQ